MQFILIHTWKAKGTKSLFSFLRYARRHPRNTDASFRKRYQDAFFPFLKPRFALRTTAQLKTYDSSSHCSSEEEDPEKPSTHQRCHHPCGCRESRMPSSSLPAPRPAPTCSRKLLREHFQEAQPWLQALCSVTKRTWKHDSLDMPGVITMELLLDAFHFLHFVEANAFGYTMSTVTDRKT